MPLLALSSRFRVVIPKDLRRQLGLKVGDRLDARLDGATLLLRRIRPLHELRGSLPGKNDFVREKKDREF